MFFTKIFKKKDYHYYLNQADRYFADERWADARCSYEDALAKYPAQAAADRDAITHKMGAIGDRLAELNLTEGEGALNSGELEKAEEYFNHALELAQDEKIREIAGRKLRALSRKSVSSLNSNKNSQHSHSSHCGTCNDSPSQGTENQDIAEPMFSAEDSFQLLIHPLPGDLPARYESLGKEFAEAYLMIHDGNDARALPILKELLRKSPNDIVMYELALIMFRAGLRKECHELLTRALEVNPSNPLCYMAQVQFYAGGGHFSEAIATLDRMLELDLLPDQARYMLGEVHEAAGDHEAALAHWSKALTMPSVARPAAEKVVALLSELGRQQEAQNVAKRYLKGCSH